MSEAEHDGSRWTRIAVWAKRLLIGWRRTLLAVWFSQFLMMAAFGFSLPFVAYHVQALGVEDHNEVRRVVALFEAAAPLTFMIFAPIWGMVADRWGRKPMLVRANIGAMVVLGGMGLAPTVGWLLFFRLGQGMLTGTMSAAQTLVSAAVPDQRRGVAMGLLATAVSSGVMAGQFLGGLFADWVSYQACFFVSAALALVAALVVLIWVEERFVRVDAAPSSPAGLRAAFSGGVGRMWSALRPVWPILVMLAGGAFIMTMERPVLPLLVQELNGGVREGAATINGQLGALSALCAVFAGLAVGRLADRVSSILLVIVAAVGAALFCAPIAVVGTLGGLFVTRAGMALFVAGLDPIFQAWLSRTADVQRQGMVFGCGASLRSMAWFMGPLLGNVIADIWDMRSVYIAKSLTLLMMVPMVLLAYAIMRRASRARDDVAQCRPA